MYLHERPDGVTIAVKVTPNASRNSLNHAGGDELEVRLTSPPVDGRANNDLVRFLGKTLGVPPSSLTILHGHTSRRKVVFVPGMDLAGVKARLESG